VAPERDQVLVVEERAGGYVHSYGLASAQLERLRAHSIPLTVAVDGIAASGGYMMACVANKIIAAPFAVIGSIGVMAELPNFHRFMKKHDVDYELHTAGKYKRTLSVMGENTEPLRHKFIEELEDVHTLFKNHVAHYRGDKCAIAEVTTGEHWHGIQALELGLVDKLQVSDDYILSFHQKGKGKIYRIEYTYPESWMDKLSAKFGLGLSKLGDKLEQRLLKGRYSKATY
jgi:serine protease SohB